MRALKIKYFILGFFLLYIFLLISLSIPLFIYDCFYRGIRIKIENKSLYDIKNIQINCAKEKVIVPVINKNESIKVKLYAQQACELEMRYQKQHIIIDSYFAPSIAADVSIVFMENNTVQNKIENLDITLF